MPIDLHVHAAHPETGLTAAGFDLRAVLASVVEAARADVTGSDRELLEGVTALLGNGPVGDVLVDQLTQLGSATAWERTLQAEAGRARRHGRPLALALFTVPAGDNNALCRIASALGDLRAGDAAFRTGPTSFALLLPETDQEGAQVAASRVVAAAGEDVGHGVAAFWGSAPAMVEEAQARLSRS